MHNGTNIATLILLKSIFTNTYTHTKSHTTHACNHFPALIVEYFTQASLKHTQTSTPHSKYIRMQTPLHTKQENTQKTITKPFKVNNQIHTDTPSILREPPNPPIFEAPIFGAGIEGVFMFVAQDERSYEGIVMKNGVELNMKTGVKRMSRYCNDGIERVGYLSTKCNILAAVEYESSMTD